jgi:hypothetical protein
MQEKEIKAVQEEIKLSLRVNNIQQILKMRSNVARYKVNIQKSIVLIYIKMGKRFGPTPHQRRYTVDKHMKRCSTEN